MMRVHLSLNLNSGNLNGAVTSNVVCAIFQEVRSTLIAIAVSGRGQAMVQTWAWYRSDLYCNWMVFLTDILNIAQEGKRTQGKR